MVVIGDDDDEKAIVRSQVDGMYDRMSTLEVGLYAAFWNDILERVNATSKTLQNPKLDINTAIACLKSLKCFVQSKRDTFDEYENQGKIKAGTAEYVQMHARVRRRNVRLTPLDYGQSSETHLCAVGPVSH